MTRSSSFLRRSGPNGANTRGDAFLIPHFSNVRELAAYLYESGYIIGSDSGVGHLAAALVCRC